MDTEMAAELRHVELLLATQKWQAGYTRINNAKTHAISLQVPALFVCVNAYNSKL